MAAVRSAAFGCCVLSTVAGLVRIFWPENGFKPVINAVLALYIITAAGQNICVADLAGNAAGIAPGSLRLFLYYNRGRRYPPTLHR